METTIEKVEGALAITPALHAIEDGIESTTRELQRITADARELQLANNRYTDEANGLTVIGQADFELAGRRVVELRAKEKEILERIKPLKGAAKSLHTATCDLEKEALKLVSAKDIFQKKADDYTAEQLQRQREEEVRLKEEARKERERQIAAAKKRLETLRGKGLAVEEQIAAIKKELEEDPAMSEIEAVTLEAELKALEMSLEGTHEKIAEQAERIEEVAFTPPPVAAPAIPQMKGASVKVKWVAEVIDPLALIKEIAACRAPISAVKAFDLTKLGNLAKDGLKYNGISYKEEVSSRFTK